MSIIYLIDPYDCPYESWQTDSNLYLYMYALYRYIHVMNMDIEKWNASLINNNNTIINVDITVNAVYSISRLFIDTFIELLRLILNNYKHNSLWARAS